MQRTVAPWLLHICSFWYPRPWLSHIRKVTRRQQTGGKRGAIREHLADGICKYSNSIPYPIHVVARLGSYRNWTVQIFRKGNEEEQRGGKRGGKKGQTGSTWLTVFVNIQIRSRIRYTWSHDCRNERSRYSWTDQSGQWCLVIMSALRLTVNFIMADNKIYFRNMFSRCFCGAAKLYKNEFWFLETFKEHSANIQWTFRAHSGNIQGTYSEHTVNIRAVGAPTKQLCALKIYTHRYWADELNFYNQCVAICLSEQSKYAY